MRRQKSWIVWMAIVCGAAAMSCDDTVRTPAVTFSASQPIGVWNTDGEAGAASHLAASAGSLGLRAAGAPNANSQGSQGTVAAMPQAAGSFSMVAVSAGTSGSLKTVSAAGHAGSASAADSGMISAAGTGAAAAGSAGASAPAAVVPTMLAFDVTTSAAGGRYQPRNIGAIWIENSSGKLVKSLEVWAGIRRRYLTRYAAALSGSAVDVTASATLSSHRAHHATWNMKDKSGAAASPGRYTLVMELTDADTTGRSNTVEFDTSAGPLSLMPASAASFSSMQLQLQ
jgi:hypothetical protein